MRALIPLSFAQDLQLYVATLLVAGVAATAIGVVAWRRAIVPGARTYGVMAVAVAGWCLAYALELTVDGFLSKVLWSRTSDIFVEILPGAWLVFALRYTGLLRGRPPVRLVLLLALEPLVTLLLSWTNDTHGLYWKASWLDHVDGVDLVHAEFGIAAWVNTAYTYGLLLFGCALVGRTAVHALDVRRRQVWALLLGVLAPWLANVLFMLGLGAPLGLDVTPLGFALSVAAVGWAMFRFQLFDLVPVARGAVFDDLSEPIFVVDHRGRVVDLNPAARCFLGGLAPDPLGRPFERVVAGPTRAADLPSLDEEEVVVGAPGEADDSRRWYVLRRTPLAPGGASEAGQVVLLHDVTEHRQLMEERARQARLEGVLLAVRTVEHELNNELARVVGYAELLQRDPSLAPAHQAHVREALEGGRAAASLIDRLRRLTEVKERTWPGDLPATIDVEACHPRGAGDEKPRRDSRARDAA